MKYLLIVVLELILTASLFAQKDKLYISHFLDKSTDGQYFSDAMTNPEPEIHTWGPKVLDSIQICGKILRKQLENENAHPHHRLYCVNKLLLN